MSIYRTLKALSRQRVALILPGGVWVIEKAVPSDEETESTLSTCYLLGWVKPIKKAIPKGKLKEDGSLPEGNIFTEIGPLYRLTDSGWNAIHRSHEIALLCLIVALLAVVVAVLAFIS